MVDHLLGREAERGRLADLRDEVRAGNSRAVVLRGPRASARPPYWTTWPRTRPGSASNAAAAPDDSGGLTPHEWRIAYAAAQGSTSPEIAARMLLSVRTVDYHLGNVYRKLGIRSRRELAGRLD